MTFSPITILLISSTDKTKMMYLIYKFIVYDYYFVGGKYVCHLTMKNKTSRTQSRSLMNTITRQGLLPVNVL